MENTVWGGKINMIKKLMKEIEEVLLKPEHRDCVNEDLLNDIEEVIRKYINR